MGELLVSGRVIVFHIFLCGDDLKYISEIELDQNKYVSKYLQNLNISNPSTPRFPTFSLQSWRRWCAAAPTDQLKNAHVRRKCTRQNINKQIVLHTVWKQTLFMISPNSIDIIFSERLLNRWVKQLPPIKTQNARSNCHRCRLLRGSRDPEFTPSPVHFPTAPHGRKAPPILANWHVEARSQMGSGKGFLPRKIRWNHILHLMAIWWQYDNRPYLWCATMFLTHFGKS